MILYHTVTTYHLINAIVHKIKYNNDKKCVLIMQEVLALKFPQYPELKKYFDKILVLEHMFSPKNGEYPESNTKLTDKMLKKAGYAIQDFEEKNVWGSQFAFGAYLAHEQIPYIYWEEGSGLLFNKEVLKGIDFTISREHAEWCDKMGLYDGTNPCIIKRVGNLNVVKNIDIPENVEHFDVVEQYLDLPADIRKEIRSFFIDIDNIEVPESSVLILTQHFANIKIMSFEDQILIYQLTADYFFPGENLVIKPHPDDILYYGILFPDSKIIRDKFPAEFLPDIFTHKPKTIATVSSTAINNLNGYFDNIFSLGNRFERDFHFIHRYAAAVRLIECLNGKCNVSTVGAMTSVINNLMSSDRASSGAAVYVVDDLEQQDKYDRSTIIDLLESLSENSAAIFINSRQDFCFYDYYHKSLWEHIVPVCIKKKQCREDEFYADTEEEVIYFYSKNERMIKLAEELNYTQKLENTGLEVSVETLTPERKRIKVLEGILAATEERLLYYIEKYDKSSIEER